MEQVAQQKENIKAGTAEVKTIDLLKMVGHLAKDQLSRVRVPALTFSFSRVIYDYWDAFWGGHHLPLRLRIDGKVDKEIFVGRLAFATTFIIADSVYLVGKFGVWLLKKLPWGFNIWNIVLVAGLVAGFIAWVLPWWLDYMGFMEEIEQTSTIGALHGIYLTVSDDLKPLDIKLSWLPFVPIVGIVGMVGTLPFSVARFSKWRGFKSVLRKKSKPIIGDDINDS